MGEYGVWLIAATLIIVVLMVIAGRLLWQLREQRQREQAERSGFQNELAVQGVAAREGISILTRSYLAGQLGASECALRVAVLASYSAEMGLLEARYLDSLQRAAEHLSKIT